MFKYYVLYLIVMNFVDFVLMWRDKRKAQRGQWRIPEKVLLGVGVLGGCFGGFAANGGSSHRVASFKMDSMAAANASICARLPTVTRM